VVTFKSAEYYDWYGNGVQPGETDHDPGIWWQPSRRRWSGEKVASLRHYMTSDLLSRNRGALEAGPIAAEMIKLSLPR